MTHVEELDLARARDMAWQELVDTFAGEVTRRGWTMETCWNSLHPNRQDQFISMARAIRLGDEARGLRVVPVGMTPRMVSEAESAASVGIGKPVDDEAVPRVYAALLSASPFAPEDKP